MTFAIYPNELSRSLGFDNLRVAYEVIVGKTLTIWSKMSSPPLSSKLTPASRKSPTNWIVT